MLVLSRYSSKAHPPHIIYLSMSHSAFHSRELRDNLTGNTAGEMFLFPFLSSSFVPLSMSLHLRPYVCLSFYQIKVCLFFQVLKYFIHSFETVLTTHTKTRYDSSSMCKWDVMYFVGVTVSHHRGGCNRMRIGKSRLQSTASDTVI